MIRQELSKLTNLQCDRTPKVLEIISLDDFKDFIWHARRDSNPQRSETK